MNIPLDITPQTNRNDIVMNNKDLSSQRDCVHQIGRGEAFSLTAEFLNPTGTQLERFENVLSIYSTWLARAVLRQVGMEANTSLSAEYLAHPALISDPNDCTVGVTSTCKTGGSNK